MTVVPAPVQLSHINCHKLLTLELHLGKMGIKKGLQDPLLQHKGVFVPFSYVYTI